MNSEERTKFWKDHYDNFKRSDMPKTVYSRIHGLSINNFKNWFYKFERETDTGLLPQEKNRRNATLPQASSFSLVKVAPSIDSKVSFSKLIFNGITIEMAQLPDPSWLSELARKVGGFNDQH